MTFFKYNRAERATVEGYSLRIELAGEGSKEVLESQVMYASILQDQGNALKAEGQLVATLKKCRSSLKGVDTLLIATVINNLAVIRKRLGRLDEAEADYKEALRMRLAFLPPSHPDVIVVKHNLAELYIARGLPDIAAKLQEEILDETGIEESDDDDDHADESDDSTDHMQQTSDSTNDQNRRKSK